MARWSGLFTWHKFHSLAGVQAQHKLAAACGLAGPKDLAAAHAAHLMMAMLQRSEQWTWSHPDLPSFLSLFKTCPGVTLAALGKPMCLALGSITKDHDRDDRLRIALLRAVDACLEDDDQGSCLCREHGVPLLVMVLLPPLVWRAGAVTLSDTSRFMSSVVKLCSDIECVSAE
jgi:hypothetical protein